MGLSKIKTIKLKISTNPKGDVLKYLTRKNSKCQAGLPGQHIL